MDIARRTVAATIREVQRDPARFGDVWAQVSGTVGAMSDRGFLLVGNGGRRLFARADAAQLAELAPERAVRVRGDGSELSPFTATLAGVPVLRRRGLVFDVPFESTAERPMVLEIGDPAGSEVARIQLDP